MVKLSGPMLTALQFAYENRDWFSAHPVNSVAKCHPATAKALVRRGLLEHLYKPSRYMPVFKSTGPSGYDTYRITERGVAYIESLDIT